MGRTVEQRRTALGIELGSTRVKAVLLDEDLEVLATGGAEWRSELVDGHWSYALDDVWRRIRAAVAELRRGFEHRVGAPLTEVGSLGVSAMMHGHLAFDAEGELLTPFRTWQDTTTARAARELSDLFGVNIPMRWSIAHLRQAMLDDEPHVARIGFVTTLAGYVHWQLTGRKVLGVGDASGMFPIDVETGGWDAERLARFDELAAGQVPWRLAEVLPEVLPAGADAGRLTEAGALLLEPTGALRAGAVVAPPEGDAGTGMVATNSVRPRTANVSAGTSIFAMVVLDHPLRGRHEELDLVTTPHGEPVVMVHCNNGAADLQDWVLLLGEAARALGAECSTDELFSTLLRTALDGDPGAGGVVACNHLAGEPITGLDAGRPLVVREPGQPLTLANLVRAHLQSMFATLALGFEILAEEDVHVDELFAHGGVFRTKGVAQRLLAGALDVPVSVGATGGEGGAWGMALLAAYRLLGEGDLADWLATRVFAESELETLRPSPTEVAGFAEYLARYRAVLAVERAAVDALGRG
ncbi:xylulokinase [uncultured Tessaracoccus sp.]|uniref:xylulokinase n=1 Tax=uncultured Tessaracoccus sp. TaxID=905023 RepID=UPI0025EDCEE6|nr:FGGY-family carbohydrate kinase [uncultured Tessaracoccus sp.]